MNSEIVSICTLTNGEEIFYRTFNNKAPKTMLLLHGNMSSSRFFEHFSPCVKGCRIIAPDMRGFGNSSYNNNFSSLLDLAEDMSDFCDRLQLSDICVAGWSTGGGVALELAALRPDLVRCVVLLGSVSCKGFPVPPKDRHGRPIPGAYYKNREELINDRHLVGFVRNMLVKQDKNTMRFVWDRTIYVNKRPSESVYADFLSEMCKQRCSDDVYWSLASFNMTDEFNGIVDGNNRISRVRAPVLAFHGDKDYICEPWQAQENKNFLGRQMELIMLEGGGHASFTDHPEEIGQKMSRFAAKHFTGVLDFFTSVLNRNV